MKKVKIDENVELKPHVRRLLEYESKVVLLEFLDVHIDFRNEFGIPKAGHESFQKRDEWFKILVKNRLKYERYCTKLRQIAKRFGFKDSEFLSLEEYLQMGEPFVLTRSSLAIEKENTEYRLTRDWETALLAKRVAAMRDKDMKYKEIAGYYNQILKSLNIPKEVKTASLRQVMSRVNVQLEKMWHKLLLNVI